ncbi:MAG: dockerin type I repeat-containing protein [Planctomycetota bacterium]
MLHPAPDSPVRTRRTPLLLALATLATICFAFSSTASAQILGVSEFEVSISSEYFDDCDPGTSCLVVYCGVFDGSMIFEYSGFDGTYDEYVVSAEWYLRRNFCPPDPSGPVEVLVGTGTLQIDRNTPATQRLAISFNPPFGPPLTADSGFVVPTVAFPSFVGFPLVSVPTAESFDLYAERVPSDDFVRGDANSDGAFDVADAIFTLATLFQPGSPTPACDDSADANDDGGVDISDAVYALASLFQAGAPSPTAPFPECGPDPTDDSLGCNAFSPCP